MLEKIRQTAEFIKNIIKETPDFAIVLGSGLGKLQDEVEAIHTLEYSDKAMPNVITVVKGLVKNYP
ncbi:purine nucleoside phosphorylase [Chryseobacterium ginsenosidimutans]|nr:purine nucleoside phosphorylase [Chryseobacterium ginsenosidimutans]